jgi:hypothetical protein
MKDFVDSSGFVNKKEASVALVERLHEHGPIDERFPSRRTNDCMFSSEYPYFKTYAGALQLAKMPWDYKNDARNFMIGSVVSAILGASII